ncbi:MAG TPA: hypothetical protein VMB50_15305 [Myxococcales bacterium]|nr:hypothetical protein [Myxococcales bacterium]
MKRVSMIVAGWAAAGVLAGCPTLATDPDYQFTCPDQQCPSGQSCGSDGFCHAATGTATGSASAGTTGASSGSTGGSTGASAASTSGGSGSTGHGTTTSGTSSGGSSGGSSTGGGPPANFAGDWDTNNAFVSITQADAGVTGVFNGWGYTTTDPSHAGTLSGTVSGNTLTGSRVLNDGSSTPLSLTLSGQALSGSWSQTNMWCGVPHGSGPLPVGCGWSDTFNIMYAAANGTMTLTQVGDQVTGSYGGSSSNTLLGLVSDWRLDGQFVSGGSGRFSFNMTFDGSQFSGNFAVSPPANQSYTWQAKQWCGARGASGALPTTCLGGGGPFAGSWFTNLGVLTFDQPFANGVPGPNVSGVWFWYGSTTEYPVSATVTTTANDGPSITWLDDGSVLDGGQQLTTFDGLTLSAGESNAFAAPWCGAIVGTNSAGVQQIGALANGCGLTGSNWQVWSAIGGASVPGRLEQVRGQVGGSVSASTGSIVLDGGATYDPGGGFENGYLEISGSWSDTAANSSGTFSWYPSAFSGSFSGDQVGPSGETPWCGAAAGGSQPSPCEQ